MSLSAEEARARIQRMAPAFLLPMAFLAFLPVLSADFVNWDDPVHIVDNPHYRGLGARELEWMLTTRYQGHYHPLTWLTFGLDYVLWGMDPRGYHLTSLILHAANMVLVYFVILSLLRWRMSPGEPELRDRVAAAFGALFYAVHPFRVESVAWVTERRDVLCGFFAFLSVLAYVAMARRREEGRPWGKWLALSASLFAASLLSKALSIMLPAVLIIVDLYPLRRFSKDKAAGLLLEKLPFFLLAAADFALMIWAMKGIEAVRTVADYAWFERFMQAAYGVAFYPLKTALPFGFSPLYSIESGMNPWEARFFGALAFDLLLVGALVAGRRRFPGGLAAFGSFVLLVFPVLGLAVVGHQLVADRYSYLSCMPFSIVAAGLLRRAPWPRAAVPAGLAVALLGILTFVQARVWKDSVALWDQVLRHDPEVVTAYNMRGLGRTVQGDFAGAVADFDQAVRRDPRHYQALNNRGIAKLSLRDFSGAVEDFTRCLRLKPNHEALNNRGIAKASLGDLAGAIEDYAESIRSQPNSEAYKNRARAYASLGRLDEAIVDYTRCLELAPRNARVLNNRAWLKLERGDPAGAAADCTAALEIDRSFPEAYVNRGLAREKLGDPAGARADYEAALRSAPPDWPGRNAVRSFLDKLR